jgi:TonB family protein
MSILLSLRTRISFLLGILLCGSLALAQFEELSSELVKHTLVLRNFYSGQKLKFDARGTLVSGGAPGSSPSDGRVYVKAVQVEAKRLIIRGERPVPVFDPATGETSWLGLHQNVDIEAQLPVDATPATVRTELLNRIFLTPDELKAIDCSAGEERAFRERMMRAKEFVSAKPDAQKNNEEPHQLCFPGGSRAYVTAKGVTLPQELKSYDPPYPPSELVKRENKTVVLAIIVDTNGKPSSMVIVGATATVFDIAAIEAVKGWKFRPGSYQGKAVPTAISVAVNFKVR